MTSMPLEQGGEPSSDQLFALLAGITAAAEGEIRVYDRSLLAANGRSLMIYRDHGRECIVLKLADDVPTGAPSSALEAWEDTFVGGVPPELAGRDPRPRAARRRR